MSQRHITIRITRDGEVFAETHGMKGKECLPYISLLEEMLEAEAVDSDYTSEFHEVQLQQDQTAGTHLHGEQR